MSVMTHDTVDFKALNAMSPQELLQWAYAYAGERAAIVTSFQTAGCVLIDMAHEIAPKLRVLTVDTLRLHDETYAVMEAIERRYGIRVERFQPDPRRIEKMVESHGEFLFFDSKDKQEYCCQVRKVEPNEKAIDTLDIWFTGLRRDQSAARQGTARVNKIRRGNREVIKISPLADWPEQDIWNYIKERDVPYNKLYDLGYASIGCMICTTPVKPWEDKRAGRWRWFNALDTNDKECGIHTFGSGI